MRTRATRSAPTAIPRSIPPGETGACTRLLPPPVEPNPSRLFGKVDVTADVAARLAQRAAEALGLRVVALGEDDQVPVVNEGDDLVDDRLHPGVAGDRHEPRWSQRDHAPALV